MGWRELSGRRRSPKETVLMVTAMVIRMGEQRKYVRTCSESLMAFMRKLTFYMRPALIVRWQIECSYRAVRNVFMISRTRVSCINGKETAGIADQICPADAMGATDKGVDAIVCPGYDDYQYRLDHSLANRVFPTCESWCVYDIYKIGYEAFIWNNAGCWKPVTRGLCISKSRHRMQMTDYIENILCEATTPEPTEAPTCIAQREWSEDLMDNYCSVEDTRLTYKHYSNISRAAVPCSGFEERAGDLLKSLAMRMYAGCSSWCVYDYSSNALLA